MTDLSDLPDWLRALMIYGPLGLWCALGSYAAYTINKSFHLAREGWAKAAETAGKEHAAEIKELGESYMTKMTDQAKLHYTQQTELTAKFVAQTQEIHAQTRLLADKVTGLVDSMIRQRERSA